MEIIDQKILHDSVRWPLSPEYGGDYLFNNTRKKKDTIAGDIVVANNAGDKLFVPQAKYAEDKAKWTEKGYEPIAVVVVPASHTDDGTARCCSLKVMNPADPENGIDATWSVVFGPTGVHVPGITQVSVFEFKIPGTTTSGSFGSLWYVPSDNEKWDQPEADNPFNTDPIAKKIRATLANIVISPYGPDGISKNPGYYTANAIGAGCMDGKGDTQMIINYANTVSTSWLTDNFITNSVSIDGYFPQAFCCQRYRTTGTNSGEWYLPAIGELGYFVTRSNEIRKAFIEVGIVDDNTSNHITYVTWASCLASSTEQSTGYTYGFYTSSGNLNIVAKYNTSPTLAFIKI